MTTKRILRTPEAAVYVGLSPSTLEKKRLDGSGPDYFRLGGRAVGYDQEALDSWLERQRESSTSEPVSGVPMG